jgi:hypothetical protein
MISTGDNLVFRVENLYERIVVPLVYLNQIYLSWYDRNTRCSGLPSEGLQRSCDNRRSAECLDARDAGCEPWHRAAGEENRRHETSADAGNTH